MQKTTTDAHTKRSLPLFGKKKTFGFDKLKLQVSTKQSTSSNQSEASAGESIEEFDDDDKTNEISAKKSEISSTENVPKTASTKSINDNSISHISKSCDEPTQDFVRETNVKEIPITQEKKTSEGQEIQGEQQPEGQLLNDDTERDDDSKNALNVSSTSSNSSSGQKNKHKGKSRQRNKVRHQIDIDETEEDTSPQKYSGWMPPDNQTGDGMTALNSKYGY